MANLHRWYDYSSPGLWLAGRSHVDPVPHTGSVGRSEYETGAEAIVETFEPARSLVDRSVATPMVASIGVGFVLMLILGLA